jgi:protein-disulfide isomerase
MSATANTNTILIAAYLLAGAVVGPVVAYGQAPASEAPTSFARGEDVVAKVGDRIVRIRDLEQIWLSKDVTSFARMQQQLYDFYKGALDELIDQQVIEAEAQRRGISVDELLTRYLPSLAEPVSELEIKQEYGRSPMNGQGVSLEQMTPMINAYLTRQKVAAARERFVQELRSSTPVEIVLRYRAPRQAVATDDTDPMKGSRSSAVEIVEFSDFQCPYCRQLAPVLHEISAKYGERVRIVWKDFPLPNHRDAQPAAEAAHCANEQGQFWPYHDVLYHNQDRLGVSDLKQHARDLGLNPTAFDQCFDSGTFRGKVAASVGDGRRYRISATPTVFINGRVVAGARPFEEYDAIVREELDSASGARSAANR